MIFSQEARCTISQVCMIISYMILLKNGKIFNQYTDLQKKLIDSSFPEDDEFFKNDEPDLLELNLFILPNRIYGKRINRIKSRRNTNQQKLISLNNFKFIILIRISKMIKRQRRNYIKNYRLRSHQINNQKNYIKRLNQRKLRKKNRIEIIEIKTFDEEELTIKEKEEKEQNKTILKTAEIQKDNDIVVEYYK
ncbi:unnamed protein product [Paramecium pentaurelia]|uniref:Uncharacterized protein n=1 Tax=Paramecium pentaurelia TaxID=43138 RepID=A0A8S1XVG4_9CILI|nr:unnamed protein product [Paramecium pentaurelia]